MTVENLSILVCDDSILARKKLSDFLVSIGCSHIEQAADGQSAINMYKELKPDLVFLDIVMPVKDGITAVKEIVAFDSDAHIVMTSSVGTQENLKEALKAGAKDFIQKPLDNDQIKHVIMSKVEGGK